MGRWECGTYVACAFEDSAYVSVSFFLLLLFREFNDCVLCRAPSSPPYEVTCLRNQMANILHALSSTFTRDCTLTQMAVFVDGQEHFTHLLQQAKESNHAYTTSGRIRKGRDFDLGPLVRSTRKFRTRERAPMSGGLSGMEMDGDAVPVVHVTVQCPSPQKRSTKGKERAVESDVDMLVDDEERKERSRETKGLCCFFILLFMTGAHLFLTFTFRNTKLFEITSQRHLYTSISRFSPHIQCDLSQLQERNYLRICGLQTLQYQRTAKTIHRQSWARTGCCPRCASGGCIVRLRR